jgi:hypothetical protein
MRADNRKSRHGCRKKTEKKVDQAVDMTFPASDVPAAGKPTSTEPPTRPVDRKPPLITRDQIEQAQRGAGHAQATPTESPAPTLQHQMTYRFRMRGPMKSTKGSPRGELQYWEMSEGTLSGADLRARIAVPGGDWFQLGPDGFGRPDVRVQLETDDGAR